MGGRKFRLRETQTQTAEPARPVPGIPNEEESTEQPTPSGIDLLRSSGNSTTEDESQRRTTVSSPPSEPSSSTNDVSVPLVAVQS